jgi:hypothetical protein
MAAQQVVIDGEIEPMTRPLDMEAEIDVHDASIILEALVDNKHIPFLTKSPDGQIYVLNSHTFSEADFKAVGEVLLCPRQLGLLDMPESWANILRDAFNEKQNLELEAPTRVTLQTLENGDIVLHNYNKEVVEVKLKSMDFNEFYDVFKDRELSIDNNSVTLSMNPRSRVWMKKINAD